MNKKLFEKGKSIYDRYPSLRPLIGWFYESFFLKPTFSGWGMSTQHELPWENDPNEEVFRRTCIDVKKFEFTKNTANINVKNIDELMWRHWIVSYAVRYAIEFSKNKVFNFVECGVGDGVTTFFALREIFKHKKVASKFFMHLYDSWKIMNKEQLKKSELTSVGKYANLDIEITKKNLNDFKDNIVFHQGYIPESFMKLDSPDYIIYLHIDLNSAKATLATLKFFFPRILKGGVILFDDYGWLTYKDTKKIVHDFFSDKPGILMKLPTGQAIYYC